MNLNNITASAMLLLLLCCQFPENESKLTFSDSLVLINELKKADMNSDSGVFVAYLNGDCHDCIKKIRTINRLLSNNQNRKFSVKIIFYTNDPLVFDELMLARIDLKFPAYLDVEKIFAKENSLDTNENPNHFFIIEDGIPVYHTYDIDKKIIDIF